MKTSPLLFDWPHRHRIHLLFPATLLAAALAHAAIFFLFSVVYPTSGFEGLNPGRVYFLPEGGSDLAQLDCLLASNDPALYAPGHHLGREEFASVATYVPQYNTARLALLNPPHASSPRNSFPRPSGRVEIFHERPASLLPSVPRRTRLTASPEIAERLADLPDGLSFQTTLLSSPEPGVFFVAVSPEGTVVHILVDRSSGDLALDLAAENVLRSLRFTPTGAGKTAWGFIHFDWGADVVSSAPDPLAAPDEP